MNTETSILLPAATVDFFLKDRETIDAAHALSKDWRFARVRLRVNEGSVEEAIRLYNGGASPEIIFIETDTTDESFVARLGELSSHCSETTSAVVIGPVNDVNLYRKITAMGVSDYLVRPVPQETLGDVVAKGLIDKLGAGGSRVVAVIGAKGGVGASSIAAMMASLAADRLDQKTFLFDAAGAWSSLGVGIGFEPVSSTAEAAKAALARDFDSFKRIQHVAGDRLRVLATGMEPMLETGAQPSQFEDILNMAMGSYPVVVADLSGAPAAVKKALLLRAHGIVVVTTPTLSSLRAARSMMNEIKTLHGGQDVAIDLIVNMEGIAPGKEVAKADIKVALEREPSAVIPFDAKLFIGAESDGRIAVNDKQGASVADRLLPVLRKSVAKGIVASKTEPEASGLVGSLLGKLKPKK